MDNTKPRRDPEHTQDTVTRYNGYKAQVTGGGRGCRCRNKAGINRRFKNKEK